MPAKLTEVLVVGAGPVGLTLAAALTRFGVTCRVIDKAPAPSDKSKALAVWCRTMELLDGIGLAETFVNTGLKLTGGSIYAHGERLVHLNLTSDESPFGFPLMIPQNQTERLLTEHLAKQGIAVERPVELVHFAEQSDGVACTLRHADGREENLTAAWLVGCDGAHSTVRHGLGLEFTGSTEPNDWILADVHVEGPLARDEVTVHWHEDGVIAFFPIDRDRFRMIADIGEAKEHATLPEVTLESAQATLDQRGPGGLTLSHPVWLSNFRINERKVADYRVGRVMVAGDAAHIHSPAGGQGMNTGMQDAFNLAWKLALIQSGAGKPEPLLESYSVERSEVGDKVLANAGRFTALATLRSPIAQWLRNHIAPVLGSFHGVQDTLRDDWFELSINYRHSPLSKNDWPAFAGGLPAGDRLCDAPLISATSGKAASLFEAIRNPHHNLLLLPGTEGRGFTPVLLAIADAAKHAYPKHFTTHLIAPTEESTAPHRHGAHSWLDPSAKLHDRLGAIQATAIVVRPDGYSAYRCQPATVELVMGYLAEYLRRDA